jgi:hypothetical protein
MALAIGVGIVSVLVVVVVDAVVMGVMLTPLRR